MMCGERSDIHRIRAEVARANEAAREDAEAAELRSLWESWADPEPAA